MFLYSTENLVYAVTNVCHRLANQCSLWHALADVVVCQYISFLMTVPELEFVDEIPCGDLFEGDERERILIFFIFVCI